MKNRDILYNIYFGTIGKKLGVKYRYSMYFKNDKEALGFAKNAASSFYYKNEGKCGLPSFDEISKESEITGLSLEELYNDHINDMCRWYAIPADQDTIPSNELKY